MNFIQFSIYLSGLYLIYYSLNVLYDIFILKIPESKSNKTKIREISFPHATVPIQVSDITEAQDTEEVFHTPGSLSSGAVESTGGVSIKELFSLAQNDLIEFTKAIPY